MKLCICFLRKIIFNLKNFLMSIFKRLGEILTKKILMSAVVSLLVLFIIPTVVSCGAEPEDKNTSSEDKRELSPALLSFSTPEIEAEYFNLGEFVPVTFQMENKGETPSKAFQMRYFISLDEVRDDSDTLIASPLIFPLDEGKIREITTEIQMKYSTNPTGLDWYSEVYLGYYVKSPDDLKITGDTEGFMKFTFPNFQTEKVVQLSTNAAFLFLDSVAFANIDPLGAFKEEIVYTYSGNGSTDAGLYYALIQNVNFTQIQETKIEEDAYGMPAIADWDTNGNDLLELGTSKGDNNRYYYYYYDGFEISTKGSFFITNTIFNLATDTDNDGDIDLVILTGEDGENTLYHYENTAGNGEPSFTKHEVDDMSGIFADMVGGDFDGDGDIDLLVSDPENGSVYHRRGSSGTTGFSSIATPTISRSLRGVYDLEVIDFDNDGDLDALASIKGEGTNDIGGIYFLENEGDGLELTLEPQLLFETKKGIHSFKVADMDRDNDNDIVLTQYEDDRVLWYDNLANNENVSGNDWGIGEFFARPVAFNVEGAYAIDVANLDGDEDIDVVSIGRKESAIYVHVNRNDDGQ